jgi:hypothetical protein
MPLCWIFLLKRRRALSNVSFSPTRTSANPGSPPQAKGLACAPSCSRPAGSTCPRPVPRTCARRSADRLAEHSGCPLTGQPRTERAPHGRRARPGTSARRPHAPPHTPRAARTSARRPPPHERSHTSARPRTSAAPAGTSCHTPPWVALFASWTFDSRRSSSYALPRRRWARIRPRISLGMASHTLAGR